MKIQALAIIAIMLFLPMTLILSAYVKNQTKTLDYQVSYDTKLQNSTYDALKAFQLNSSNSDTSDIANSRLRDVKAGANTFFNSLASAFNMPGYGKEELQNYVPAVVFTMYDGYYIYGPFENVLTKEAADAFDWVHKESDYTCKYEPGQELEDLKPYIYYSCRYKTNKLDVVITYALDNYVVIQGEYKPSATEDGITIDIDGYLLDNVKFIKRPTDTWAEYRGTRIGSENTEDASNKYKEKVYFSGDLYEAFENTVKNSHNNHMFFWPCRKINGVRYYISEEKLDPNNGLIIKEYPGVQSVPNRKNVYTLLNGQWIMTNYVPTQQGELTPPKTDQNTQTYEDIKNNINALEYYEKAAILKAFLTGNSSFYNDYIDKILVDSGVDKDKVDKVQFGGSPRTYEYLKKKLEEAGEKIGDLTVGDACTFDGEKIIESRDNNKPGFDNLEYFGNKDDKIFAFDSGEESDIEADNPSNYNEIAIEEPRSNFNEHRLDVIRYSIESNLSIAISNFNSESNSTTYDFQMPRLKDTDWEKIYDNISIISFMQGLSIGGKIYSGYSVIPNNNNKEVVTEKSMVFVNNNNASSKSVYDVTSNKIVEDTNPGDPLVNLIAVSKPTVTRSSTEDLGNGTVHYFYRYPDDSGWFDYDSIVTSINNNSDYSFDKDHNTYKFSNIYDYVQALGDKVNSNIAKEYFTGLARERQGQYRAHNNGVFMSNYEGSDF